MANMDNKVKFADSQEEYLPMIMEGLEKDLTEELVNIK